MFCRIASSAVALAALSVTSAIGSMAPARGAPVVPQSDTPPFQTYDSGFLIVEMQGCFHNADGTLVVITGGIGKPFTQEYARAVYQGIQAAWPGARDVVIYNGETVKRAVTDRMFIKWVYSPSPRK